VRKATQEKGGKKGCVKKEGAKPGGGTKDEFRKGCGGVWYQLGTVQKEGAPQKKPTQRKGNQGGKGEESRVQRMEGGLKECIEGLSREFFVWNK